MKCKYVEQNNKERKCNDYFMHEGYTQMCRLPEWRRKKGVCPYDKTIVSKSLRTKKTMTSIKDKKQTTLSLTLLFLLIPLVSAWEWCEKPGYQYCIEQKGIYGKENLTSKIAINLYDYSGESYDSFLWRGFAIKTFYADVYYEGQELYYSPNLSKWEEACPNETNTCKGERIFAKENPARLILGMENQEYEECPLFISVQCDKTGEWCVWSGMGWLKDSEYDCAHIRVTECFFDDDCQENEICDKTNTRNWRNWTCKEAPENTTRTTRTEQANRRTISAGGYSPEYTQKDFVPNFIETIINFIKGIGKIFGGGKR